jgi:16S rRNA (adenine1518-N6/adenine1519-N6)-dimethyltransferase
MDLFSANNVKNILEKFEAKPKKGLGQNFLIDNNILQKIIDASDIKPTDVILEVGPGVGTLTQELAKKAKLVIAVEKDEVMCKILKENLKDFKNIKIINEDILKFKTEEKKYKVIANIPYYLTSPLIRKFLEEGTQPEEIILMIQKEVAQRICSKVPDMNLLAVSVQFYADPKIIFNVSKNSFWPIPKIDSAIIKITPNNSNNINPESFFKVVKAGFSQPRKQLGGNLSRVLKMKKEEINKLLSKNNLTPNQRAETLTISDWQNLTKSFLSNEFIDKK